MNKMARLSTEKIQSELKEKGFILIDDANYTSVNSDIEIQCSKGHKITTSLNKFRHVSFYCPECDKDVNFKNPRVVPEKKGYRIIAFDQATERFGLSIFDNGELVFYNLYSFSGDLSCRLMKIRLLIKMIIENWQPDYIFMEDIQYQNNALTFKTLAMLLGVIQELCYESKVGHEVVLPMVWRKHNGIAGKSRKEEKKAAQDLVFKKYGINVSDDVAEAILIGRYGTMIKNQIKWAF